MKFGFYFAVLITHKRLRKFVYSKISSRNLPKTGKIITGGSNGEKGKKCLKTRLGVKIVRQRKIIEKKSDM